MFGGSLVFGMVEGKKGHAVLLEMKVVLYLIRIHGVISHLIFQDLNDILEGN